MIGPPLRLSTCVLRLKASLVAETVESLSLVSAQLIIHVRSAALIGEASSSATHTAHANGNGVKGAVAQGA